MKLGEDASNSNYLLNNGRGTEMGMGISEQCPDLVSSRGMNVLRSTASLTDNKSFVCLLPLLILTILLFLPISLSWRN